VLDLFAGACGGWSLGLHRAGYETVAACEIDPWRRACFSRNFPRVRMYADVRELSGERLRADGVVPDVIVGSPPCQDASTANTGGRGVRGGRTGLFFEAVRLVGEIRPLWFGFENVPGIRTRGIDRLIAPLEAHGYACWPLVVGAVHAGAPHRRKRMWLIGADADGRKPQEPGRQSDGRLDMGAGANGDALPADANGDALRQQCGRGEPGRPGEAIARIAEAWPRWNGGAAGIGALDDGLPKGVARAPLAAYGDAIVPQIAEAIGFAMRELRHAL
jgi:DNA (cytosine-5)-methyltransferase 1